MHKTNIIVIASILSFSIVSYQNIPRANANPIIRILQSLQKLSRPAGKVRAGNIIKVSAQTRGKVRAGNIGQLSAGNIRQLSAGNIKQLSAETVNSIILPSTQGTFIDNVEYITNHTNSNLKTVEIAAENIMTAKKKVARTVNEEEIAIEEKKIDYELGRIAKLTLDTEQQRNYIAHVNPKYLYNDLHNNSKFLDKHKKTINNNYHEIIKIYYNMMLIATVISTSETLKSLEYEPSDAEVKKILHDSASEKNDKHLKIIKENEIAKIVDDGIKILKNKDIVASFRDELEKNGVS